MTWEKRYTSREATEEGGAVMQGRPLVLEWQEPAAELHRAYRQEPLAEVRLRLHALWLLRSGQSARAAAQVVGVHESTVSQWVSWYRQGGLVEVRRHRQGGCQGRRAKLTPEQDRALCKRAATGAFRTAAEVRQWVAETFDVAYTPQSIYRVLRRLRIHPKVPRPQAAKASTEAQAAWKKGAAPAP
jgi:transposase